MKTSTIETLAWTLIYGGLLLLIAGAYMQQVHDPIGWTLVVVGGGIAAVGATLIVVRSRMKDPP